MRHGWIFAGAHVAQTSGMDANLFAVAIVALIAPALVGSRLLFVFTHWGVYRRDLSRIWRRSEGGMAMYGGLIATVPLSIPLLRTTHLPFADFWDVASVLEGDLIPLSEHWETAPGAGIIIVPNVHSRSRP